MGGRSVVGHPCVDLATHTRDGRIQWPLGWGQRGVGPPNLAVFALRRLAGSCEMCSNFLNEGILNNLCFFLIIRYSFFTLFGNIKKKIYFLIKKLFINVPNIHLLMSCLRGRSVYRCLHAIGTKISFDLYIWLSQFSPQSLSHFKGPRVAHNNKCVIHNILDIVIN